MVSRKGPFIKIKHKNLLLCCRGFEEHHCMVVSGSFLEKEKYVSNLKIRCLNSEEAEDRAKLIMVVESLCE